MPATTKGLRYPSSTDAPNIPLDIQKLAQDVDTALPGTWINIVTSNSNYNAVPATTWATLTDYAGATITVPAGRTMDVEWQTPFVTTGTDSRCSVRLKIGSSYPRSCLFETSGSTAAAGSLFMSASVVGTGVGLSVSVEAQRGTGSASIRGDGVTGPSLRYRIV